MKIVVLGAGVVGVTTAYYLARGGHLVTVVDRQPKVAQETSFANAGLVNPSGAEPWNPPGTLTRLLHYLGREDSPLLLRPGAVPGMAAWGLLKHRPLSSSCVRSRGGQTGYQRGQLSRWHTRFRRLTVPFDYDGENRSICAQGARTTRVI